MALVYCGLAAATTASYLTVAIVDDGGRLVDMRDISDDPAGFARLSCLLAERSSSPAGAAIATDSGAYLVARLLAAAQRPLAITDERAVSDFAWRFADDASLGALASSAAERRAIGLARALLGGAIWASTQQTSPELEALRPVVAAYSAMAAGRQAAVTALREVLREVYPAALRAYPDPHEPIPLMIVEALPDPSFINQPAQTDAEVVDELARAGGYDPAAIRAAVASLRFAATELPARVLGSVGATAVRQAIAALRACDAAASCLVGALIERLGSPIAPVSGNPVSGNPVSGSPTSASPVPAAAGGYASAGGYAAGSPSFASSTPGSGFAPVPAPAAYPPPPGGSGFVTVGGPSVSAPTSGGPGVAAPTAGGSAESALAAAQRQAGATYASGAYSGMSGPASYPPAPAAPAYPPQAAVAPPAPSMPPPAPSMPPAPPSIPHQAQAYSPPAPAYAPPALPPHLTAAAAAAAAYAPFSPAAPPTVPPQRAASEPTLAPRMPTMPMLDPLSDPLPPREAEAPPLSWDAPTPSGRIRPPWLADDLPQAPESVRRVDTEPLPRLSLADPLTDPLGPDPFAGMRYDPPPGVSPIDTGEYAMAERARVAARPGGADDGLLIFSQTAPPAWFSDEEQLAQTPKPNWGRLADDGWRAAEQLARQPASTATISGLPVRVPQANLVPGAALPPPRSLRIVRDPQSIAAHTTGYFRGWRRGQEIGGFAIGQRDRGAWEFNREQRAREAREAREAADMRAWRS